MQLGLGAEGEGPGAQRGSWTGQAPGQGLTMGAEPPLPQLPKVSPQHAQSQALAPSGWPLDVETCLALGCGFPRQATSGDTGRPVHRVCLTAVNSCPRWWPL